MVRGRRLGKTVSALLLAGATGLLFSSPAGAAAGGTSDPDEDGVGGASIDIRHVTHSDTATEIIYTVEAYADFPADTPNFIEWSLKFSGDAFDDAVAFVNLSDLDNISGGFQCGQAGDDVDGTVTLKETSSDTSTDKNTVELRFPRPELANCGAGASYAYIVASNNTGGDPAAPPDDKVPDSFDTGAGITHTLTSTASTTTTRASTSTTRRAPATPPFRDRNCTDFNTQKQAQVFFDRNNPVQDPHNLDSDGDGTACEELARKPGAAAAANNPEIAATGTETPIRLVLAFLFLDAGCLAICLAGYRRARWAGRVSLSR